MQRRAQVGLNKGEAHHALKNALRVGRQGEIRDRTTEGQHYRIAGLNLLTAIIVYWNTLHLGHAVEAGAAKVSTPLTISSPMLHRSDGRTSSSPASTSGPTVPTLRVSFRPQPEPPPMCLPSRLSTVSCQNAGETRSPAASRGWKELRVLGCCRYPDRVFRHSPGGRRYLPPDRSCD